MKRALPLLHLEHVDLIGALSGTHLQKLEVDGCIYFVLDNVLDDDRTWNRNLSKL